LWRDAQKMADMKPSVLLVDDDALLQELMSSHLADAGFEIIAARNGTQALTELDADATRFKAVITDINLGTGPDGWDVGRHARELVSDMPIIYISGDSGSEWSSQGVPDSVMITKPSAPAQLATAVATLITSADTLRSASQDKA
jgi:DNA-binding response OmpR family regulator